MAYWWVSQNKTYKQEQSGGYLWAPKVDPRGLHLHHWDSMLEVKPGDVIFCFVNQHISKIAVATSAAIDKDMPGNFQNQETWQKNGNMILATYEDIPSPIGPTIIKNNIAPLLPEKYSPLNRNGTGNQGYLFSLNGRAGRLMLELSDYKGEKNIDRAEKAVLNLPNIPETEKQAIVKSRVGQGRFREGVLSLWSRKCAVTGLSIENLVRASHIKPWADSDNVERLDSYNGLPLSPIYDAAFDAGYISFGRSGEIIVSAALPESEMLRCGISNTARIDGLTSKNLEYLDYHRREVFIREISTQTFTHQAKRPLH